MQTGGRGRKHCRELCLERAGDSILPTDQADRSFVAAECFKFKVYKFLFQTFEAFRSDSGATPADMKINVVLAARWSAEHAGPPNPAATITMTQIRRLVPLETSPVPIYGSSQYDVYCWAKAGFLMLDLLLQA